MKNLSWHLKVIAILLGCLLLPSLGNAFYQKEVPNQNAPYYKQFQEVFERIQRDYVQEPDKQKVIDAALEGMLASLDPHSSYFADDDLEDLVNHTKGEFGGIGVEIIYDNGAIKIVSPIDDLPAAKAGIKAGDYIVKVGDETINSLGYNKAVKQMRGEPGTKVKISIFREGENTPLEFELLREIVKIKPVKHQLDNNIGYLRVVVFNEHTTTELKKAIKALEDESKGKLKGLVLDVRNNPGGLLDQAISVSDYFLDHGLIVSTKGRTMTNAASFSAKTTSEKAPNLPMVVLINGGSASASEIVAGALQDHRRAIIVGTKSFGKGSVQTLMPISNRAAIKITTAKYYTPSGKSIQAEGISPDIVVEPAKIEYAATDSESKKFSEKSFKNYLKNDQINEKKQDVLLEVKEELSETYKKDFQYARAYDLLKSIIILDKNYARKQ